jgi:hypothetical protein
LSRRALPIESRLFDRWRLSNRCRTYNALRFACALSLYLLLLNRFSLLPFPLLDNPQPRKTGGEDHHDDQNGILDHWSVLS